MAEGTAPAAHRDSPGRGPGGDRPVRVLLVEDHEVVRIGLRQLVDAQPGLEVCGEAATLATARAALARLTPDVVLLDLTLGEDSGLELLRELQELEHAPRVLVLSMYDEALYSDDAIGLGARGYAMKDAPPEDLIKALRTVAAGGLYLSERLSQRVMRRVAARGEHGASPQESLTAREHEVVELLGSALTTREIAARMGTAVKTIDSHKRNICEKLGLESAAALLRYAVVNTRERRRL